MAETLQNKPLACFIDVLEEILGGEAIDKVERISFSEREPTDMYCVHINDECVGEDCLAHFMTEHVLSREGFYEQWRISDFNHGNMSFYFNGLDLNMGAAYATEQELLR